jgi:hypothetical protein
MNKLKLGLAVALFTALVLHFTGYREVSFWLEFAIVIIGISGQILLRASK